MRRKILFRAIYFAIGVLVEVILFLLDLDKTWLMVSYIFISIIINELVLVKTDKKRK
ncbi:hypothetical protein [Virgibacillus halodenitrificans]|uniref:hypothetical protein n=1 Tax=Virgibacillus halodenitrificans TaxID=1482 RepID=UPI0002E712E5|nr:hypothetical protein [Virgibacillus halodenitrificans]